jgi:hypothetical protein
MDYRLQGGLINSQRAPLDLPAGWVYDSGRQRGALHNTRNCLPMFFAVPGRKGSAQRGDEAVGRGGLSDDGLCDGRGEGGGAGMAQVRVFYDRAGNTLTVWFGDPQDEYVCEETGDEVILMKDRSGQVIGFEKLNFSAVEAEPVRVAFEAVTA